MALTMLLYRERFVPKKPLNLAPTWLAVYYPRKMAQHIENYWSLAQYNRYYSSTTINVKTKKRIYTELGCWWNKARYLCDLCTTTICRWRHYGSHWAWNWVHCGHHGRHLYPWHDVSIASLIDAEKKSSCRIQLTWIDPCWWVQDWCQTDNVAQFISISFKKSMLFYAMRYQFISISV